MPPPMEEKQELQGKESKELLDFPVEIIQLILYHSTTPSFLQASYSCRTLFEVASTCREVVLHHLQHVPGFTLGLGLQEQTKDMSTPDLSLLLRRRASAHLFGANFSADQTCFNFPRIGDGGYGSIKVPASSVAPFPEINAVLVRGGHGNDGDTVHLFDVHNEIVTPRGMLEPPYDHPGKVEILKTVFSTPRLISVLQRYTPNSVFDQSSHPHESSFVRTAMMPFRTSGIHLVHYTLCYGDEEVEEPKLCSFPDHPNHIPITLAVASESTFAISWKNSDDESIHEVVLYTMEEEDVETTPGPGPRYISGSGVTVVNQEGTTPQYITFDRYQNLPLRAPIQDSAVTRIVFGDDDAQLLYSYGGSTLYETYQNVEYTGSDSLLATPLVRNRCKVEFTPRQILSFSIAIPFFGTHEPYPLDPTSPHPGRICNWQYLSLGVATHPQEKWTVACLLRSHTTCRYDRCGHVLNLNRGRRFDRWRVMARLWGFQKPSNSIGSVIAYSARGTRIAIANWNVIYVWALEPTEIIDGNTGDYYRTRRTLSRSSSSGSASSTLSTESTSTTDSAGAEAARNKHTAAADCDPDMIVLKPIALPVGGVCFKLEFTPGGEDELIALTDRGVMTWNLGPSGRGNKGRKVILPVESEEEGEEETEAEAEEVYENDVSEEPAHKRRHIVRVG